MKDVQNIPDYRGIDIQQVGVTNVHLPFQITMKTGESQSVLANIQLTVHLPRHYKGTHMSRFIEVLTLWSRKPISSLELKDILADIAAKTEAQRAHIEMEFKLFLEKTAPVSGLKSLLDYDCSFSGDFGVNTGFSFVLGVTVPFTSLCPCSKEISDCGAHNQRSYAKLRLKCRPDCSVWIEDIVQMVEEQGSCPVYPLLKREDEKYVTERAYENPKFVEDIIRDLVLVIRHNPDISWFDVECENQESIHNHNAYARHTEELNR